MCAKVVGGDLQEGSGFPIFLCIFERGWLKKILSKYMGVAYKKVPAYKSEYGI